MQRDDSHTTWTPPPDSLDLRLLQVDIWRVSLDLAVASVKLLGCSLSVDESQRAARFHFPADRDRYIAAHGCLRDVLSRYLRFEPSQLNFSANDYGKPALNGHELEFNLSHSGDLALIAVSRGHKVGVDVERIRTDVEHDSIASRYFSPNEVSELAVVPPDQREIAFFNCWTRKEAYIKAQGLGLSLPLDSFDVSLTPNEPAILRATRPDTRVAFQWMLLSLDVDFNYAAALAVKGQNLEFRLWNWSPQIETHRTSL
ncbi:MAG: 4'-phosphopantetheinyl transferase superfamily protein [Anaerolineales bacterium]|nr:4'-phosphopantetheinyl transferase superfamily protein [Anaerolineales bacterium]